MGDLPAQPNVLGAQRRLALILNHQRNDHAGDQRGADDGGFQFGHGHDFKKGKDGSAARRRGRQRSCGDVKRQPGGRGADGFARQRRSQRPGGIGDAAMFQEGVELFQGATHPFLRRGLIAPQRVADGTKVESLKKAKQNGRAVRGTELVDRFVEYGRNPGQARLRVILERIHFHGLPFTGSAAAFSAQGFGGHKTRMSVQPTAQPDLTGKPWRPPGQVRKDGLSHVLGQMRVAAAQSKRRRIHQVEVPRDQFTKGFFRSPRGVIRQ